MNSENTVFSFQMKEMCVCMFRGSLVRGTLRMIRKFAGPIFLSSSLSPVYYNNPPPSSSWVWISDEKSVVTIVTTGLSFLKFH